MKILTWNLLHRVHAENWGDPPPCGLEEPRRVEAIASRVEGFLADADAVCLQEVSGDQLATLRQLVGSRRTISSLVYPRVPKPKPRRGPHGLSDLTEHLVVLTTGDVEVVAARVFPNDPGKGFLAVRASTGAVVVSAHITFGDKGVQQLAELGAFAREHARAILAGDFNAEASAVQLALGAPFKVAELPLGRATRPHAESAEKSQNIDHVIGFATQALSAGVEDGDGLSDHNPVWAQFG